MRQGRQDARPVRCAAGVAAAVALALSGCARDAEGSGAEPGGAELVLFDSSADPRRGLEGHVGLQNHDADSGVDFRAIRVEPLS